MTATKKQMELTSEFNSVCNKIFKALGKTLFNLRDRWQDESQYEDFKDYVDVMKKSLKELKDIKIVKGTKRPFGFTFTWKETKSVKYNCIVKLKGNYQALSIQYSKQS